jgi:hypothetical protein
MRVTSPPWGGNLLAITGCVDERASRLLKQRHGKFHALERASKSLEHIRMDVLRVERTSPAARKSAVDHPLHGFWVAVALDLQAG